MVAGGEEAGGNGQVHRHRNEGWGRQGEERAGEGEVCRRGSGYGRRAVHAAGEKGVAAHDRR